MIINPWFFYLISVCDILKEISIICSVVSALCLAVCAFFFVVCMIDGGEENANIAKTPIKWLAPLMVFFIVFAVLLPSKETLLLMQAAKLATPENANAVFEALKTAMDYAVTLFE